MKKLFGTALLSLLLGACVSTSNFNVEPEKSDVLKLVDEYSERNLAFSPISATYLGMPGYNDKFSPIISEENQVKWLNFQKEFLDRANSINTDSLTGQDKLTHSIFIQDRELSIERSQFNGYMLPLNQMYGVHNSFAQLGSGKSPQPFKTEKDYRNFISRAKGFSAWMDSAIEAMRQGISEKIVQPKAIVKKILPQLKAQIVDEIEQSLFYNPILSMPEDIEGEARAELISDYKDTISNIIIPSYAKMHQFMQNEYLPAARETVGLSNLPNGQRWYEHMIKTHTTLPLTAEEIHEYGQQEVSRILSEMKKVKETVKFDGDMKAFFEFLRNDDQFYFNSEEELVSAYTNIKEKIDATLPKMFEVFPKAGYEVKAVPAYRAASAPGASYQAPSPDGSRPGIFYINAYNLKSQPKFIMETLSIHEAAPGHHFQIAIQQEVKGLPNYRKFGGYTVFNEGWALYAESLGKDLGLFTDPYQWYGRLVDEQLRAMRLVVDTGLHAKGWTREQAIQFMLDNSSMAESDVTAEVERYIVIPGQALAYKTGQRKIQQIRDHAEYALGEKFDIKKFHTQVLVDGSLPMPLLEQKINEWVMQQK